MIIDDLQAQTKATELAKKKAPAADCLNAVYGIAKEKMTKAMVQGVGLLIVLSHSTTDYKQ